MSVWGVSHLACGALFGSSGKPPQRPALDPGPLGTLVSSTQAAPARNLGDVCPRRLLPPPPVPLAQPRSFWSWSSVTSHRVTALPPRWLPHPLWLRGSILHVTAGGWKRSLQTKTHFTYTHSVTPASQIQPLCLSKDTASVPPPTVTSAWIAHKARSWDLGLLSLQVRGYFQT